MNGVRCSRLVSWFFCLMLSLILHPKAFFFKGSLDPSLFNAFHRSFREVVHLLRRFHLVIRLLIINRNKRDVDLVRLLHNRKLPSINQLECFGMKFRHPINKHRNQHLLQQHLRPTPISIKNQRKFNAEKNRNLVFQCVNFFVLDQPILFFPVALAVYSLLLLLFFYRAIHIWTNEFFLFSCVRQPSFQWFFCPSLTPPVSLSLSPFLYHDVYTKSA